MKRFWELNLEEIPCGWEKTYQEALTECPNGTVIEFEGMDGIEKYFYHPVKFYTRLKKAFFQAQQEAKELMESQSQMDYFEFINQLIKIDAKLYCLLDTWLYDDRSLDCSSFNPRTFVEDQLGDELDMLEFYISSRGNADYNLRIIQ